MQVEPRATWLSRGTPPLNCLGNGTGPAYWGLITEAGNRFFSTFEEYITAKYAKHWSCHKAV
jgi:hypothetical protein